MSDQDVQSILNTTGTYQTFQQKAENVSTGGKVTPVSGKEPPVAAKEQPDLQELAAKLNVASQSIGRDLRFKVDMNSGQSVIQVLDSDTGEIIREIPPEKARNGLSGNGDIQLSLYDALA